MFNKIRAVHVVVKSVDDAVKDFSDNFDLNPSRSGELPQLVTKESKSSQNG